MISSCDILGLNYNDKKISINKDNNEEEKCQYDSIKKYPLPIEEGIFFIL
jgi:hypothetical protein